LYCDPSILRQLKEHRGARRSFGETEHNSALYKSGTDKKRESSFFMSWMLDTVEIFSNYCIKISVTDGRQGVVSNLGEGG
jgi:hypothetical protein